MAKKTSGRPVGHLLAIITVLVWGVTFIATEKLLTSYTTAHLLMLRFAVGYLVLWIACPHFMKLGTVREELDYILLSLSGVTGYYLLENYAVKNGGAANTSILISVVPMVTLILMCITGRKKGLNFRHFIGFAAAIAGVCFVVYNGAVIRLDLTLAGTAGALGACVCWGIYSILVAGYSGKNPVQLARRVIFWALVVMIPFAIMNDGVPSFTPLKELPNIVCLLILGVLGSGLCYSMWNTAIKRVGVDTATNYIYLQPFITLAASVALGRSSFSVMSMAGTVLIFLGVFISDRA